MQSYEGKKMGNPNSSIPAVIVMIVLWLVGVQHYLVHQDALALMFFGYLGLTIGAGFGGFLAAPDRFRPYARRLTALLVGTLLLAVAFLSDHGNMQIEGLFFALAVGGGLWVILHFALKIGVALAFGRVWCSWACWYGMVFDMLPYPFSHHRLRGRWGMLRYVHFALSIGAVLLLIAAGYRGGADGAGAMTWFALGLLGYYVVGIAMALVLRDNRAFCKYLCPIVVPLKVTSRFSVMKVEGITADKCDTCEACVEMCPMNVRVKDYVLAGERVLSTECTMCQTCIAMCPHDSLKLSFKFDVGGHEIYDYDPSKGNRITRNGG